MKLIDLAEKIVGPIRRKKVGILGTDDTRESPALPNIFDLAEEIIDYLNMDSSLANTLKGAINNLVKPVLGIIGHLTGSEGLKQMLPADNRGGAWIEHFSGGAAGDGFDGADCVVFGQIVSVTGASGERLR
ncbi:MAG: hypothetical protein K9W44_08770 [Candidatus Lokiarchaeota archaeon]|nr:hypothetical protein [Candidatus Harpocratesius repetitus]